MVAMVVPTVVMLAVVVMMSEVTRCW